MKTPLKIGGNDKSVWICDADDKKIATISRSLGEKDYETALQIVKAVNNYKYLLK